MGLYICLCVNNIERDILTIKYVIGKLNSTLLDPLFITGALENEAVNYPRILTTGV